MRNKAKRWIALFMVLALCLSLLPASALAATTASGSSVKELGTGSYAITLKNDCDAAVKYSVALNGTTTEVTLDGRENLTLKGNKGENYSVTWVSGEGVTLSGEETKSGTFGQAASLYDGFDGADGKPYTAAEVSNAALHCNYYNYDWIPDFYYVIDSVIPFYSYGEGWIAKSYYYVNEKTNQTFGGQYVSRSDARNSALSSLGLSDGDKDRYWNQEDGDVCAMWVYWKATPYITFTAYTATEYTLSLVNDCDAPVQYRVTIGEDTQTVTLEANETKQFKAVQGTAYTITWVGGTDSSYAYVTPTVTQYTGVFGVNNKTVYYLDGEEYDGAVSDTVSYNGYNMSAGKLYAVDTLKTFTRTKNNTRYIYTNIADSGESYSATSASGARDNIMKSHSGYDIVADKSDLGYAWVFKTVTSQTVTESGDSTVTVTATAVEAGQTGSFKVAALNVDGMPQSVKIANVYDLKLNEDGPGADGSVSIGQYIEDSDIDVLALSENFNFFQEINGAAPSYATMTQRERIPTEVGVGDLNNSLFPFDTDGLNLMYKNNLTVGSESMTAWNEHYSPTTFYGALGIGIDVPDKNGADGMIDKGFRFYQVQMAPGVVVDVYILHMDAETDPGDNAARESQINQLMEAVNANKNGNPIIIMGDTNCRYTRDPLESTIIAAGFSDPWIDLERDGIYPQMGQNSIMVDKEGYQKGEVVDKVFYKNPEGSNVQIKATNYFVDAEGYTDDGGLLGDHPPVIVTFEYSFTSSTVEHEHEWSTAWSSDAGYHWHECTVDGCDIPMNSLKGDYAAHTWNTEVTQQPTCTETGSKTLTCTECGYSKTEVIPATGHSYSEAWTSDETNHWHVCTVEGCTATSTPEAHSWNEGVVTIQPTATTAGEMTYTCTVCQATKTESIPATGEPEEAREYTFEVRLDKEAYNVGDTVTAGIYVKSENEGANFTSAGFKLAIPDELTFKTMNSALTDGIIITNDGNLGFTLTSEDTNSIAVTERGVLLATATFKVNDSFNDDLKNISVGFTSQNVTESGMATASQATATSAAAILYNIRVTLKPGANATINNSSDNLPLYAKYNESGLYSDENRTEQVESVTVKANDGYRLADTQWSDGKANFAVIADTAHTASTTYTVQTVETCTITFQKGDNVTALTGNTTVTVDKGTRFSAVTKPSYTVANNYTFAGWYNGDNLMADDAVINDDITVTAKAVAATFNFTQTANNAQIQNLSGVSDGKATYGTPISFTVTPDNGYALPIVSYTVGENSTPTPLTPQNGTYTIPGNNITGNIHVYVSTTQYYTITFTNGTGVNALSGTAYALANTPGLYADTSFTSASAFTVPTPTPAEGYRLADPVWLSGDGKSYTTTGLSTAVFTGNTTLTAQAVQQWTVTFETDDRGSLSSTSVVVDNNTAVPSNKVPTVTPAAGYEFTGWSSSVSGLDIDDAITTDVTFTAQYTDASYTLSLPNITGVSYTVTVNGTALTPDVNGTYTVTHGQDVTITVNATNATINSVTYKIGNGVAVDVENFSQPFTIEGEDITGNITVNVQATNTYQITVTVEGGNGTVNGETSFTKTFAVNTPAEDVAEAFDIVANPGYTFIAPVFETVTADKIYTVTFTDATYNVTWPDDVTGMEPTATHGIDLTFTPSVTGYVVTGVSYSVNGSTPVQLQANENGTYTIPGSAITGPITVTFETKAIANWTFVTDYMAAPDGKKMAVLNTGKLDEGTYTLENYGNMYWSSKYSAYVCFVDDSETEETLSVMLTTSDSEVTEIDYTGDVNGDGRVDPTDSAIISAALHGYKIHYTLSDLWRFRFDVADNTTKKVTTQDIQWILETYTGASQN